MSQLEQLYHAVVFNVQGGVHVATVVDEFSELTKSSCITQTPLIILNGSGTSPDFKNEVVRKLIAAFPSTKAERVVDTHANMPVQGGFATKELLDHNRISAFVVFTAKENLSSLLLVLPTVFTSVYHMRVKVYGDGDVNTLAILANIGESMKTSIKQKCSEYLAEVNSIPQDKVEVIRSAIICDKTFSHGFSTRKGGCSSYPSVMSLNLAFTPEKRDPLIAVEENRDRLLKAVGCSSHRFELAKAVHGNCVWTVGSPEPPGYDAIVCDKQGVVIAAPAADCVTIIFADANRSVCAVAHSGWKGILANVTGATIDTMTKCFGCNIQDIRAAIGPSIGVCCYEIGMDVEKLFGDNSLLRQCIEVVEGRCKRHLNLQNSVRLQLLDAGISSENIDDSPSKLCTYCNEDMFFSYRRDGKPFGTHVGFIALR